MRNTKNPDTRPNEGNVCREGAQNVKKTKRGRRKAKGITIYYNNVNGIKSKLDSIIGILGKLEPEIICFCETKVGSSTTVDNYLEKAGYKGISRCSKIGEGGLIIAVKRNKLSAVMNITSSPSKRILVGRLEIKGGHLRIIMAYAPQETDDAEVREEFVDELMVEIQAGVQSGDKMLVMGDLNAKIEQDSDEKIFPVSKNGKLICEVMNEYELSIMNFSKKCVGKWTHVIRTTEAASRLDYVMTNDETEKMISSMVIDESTLMCPFGIKNKITTLSDHNAILVNIRTQSKKKSKGENDNKKVENVKWKIKADGIDKIKSACIEVLQKGGNEKLDGGEQSERLTSVTQEKYDMMERKIKEILDKCFKRVSTKKPIAVQTNVGRKFARITKRLNEFAKKGKIQRQVTKMYVKEIAEVQRKEVTKMRAARLKEIANNMSINGKFDR